jgi:hypothetical protein
MRNLLMMGAAALLLTGGIASAQRPSGQNSHQDRSPATGSGYGAPYSPRNAPQAEETTGQAPRSEDQWPTGSPNRPRATMPDFPSTIGQAFDKKPNPKEGKSGMDQ